VIPSGMIQVCQVEVKSEPIPITCHTLVKLRNLPITHITREASTSHKFSIKTCNPDCIPRSPGDSLLPLALLACSTMTTGECIGLNDTPCTFECLLYWEDTSVSPPRCQECHHGKSRHCGGDATRSPPEFNTPSRSLPTVALPSASPVKKNLKTLKLLKVLVDGGDQSLEEARRESVAGFRPKVEVCMRALFRSS
jgi:hypothetical protein